jgi:hypothetical protein
MPVGPNTESRFTQTSAWSEQWAHLVIIIQHDLEPHVISMAGRATDSLGVQAQRITKQQEMMWLGTGRRSTRHYRYVKDCFCTAVHSSADATMQRPQPRTHTHLHLSHHVDVHTCQWLYTVTAWAHQLPAAMHMVISCGALAATQQNQTYPQRHCRAPV